MIFQGDQYSHIEVAGEGIIPVLRAISAEALCKILLVNYGLEAVQPGQYCSLRNYLALLHEIEKRMPTVLNNIAELISEEALFPPTISTFEKALLAAEQFYYMNHRGFKEGEIGFIHCEKKKDQEFLITFATPYPCIFDRGVIIGLSKKFGVKIFMDHTDEKCRSKGDPQCNFQIQVIK
ncbi:MAG: hypothetical protein GY847_02440 [Proteobacteria bacterium]|nr:hypothetical protein [Pseudomonadota bacterium]